MKNQKQFLDAFLNKSYIQTLPIDILRLRREYEPVRRQTKASYIFRIKMALKNLGIKTNYKMTVGKLYT